MTGPVGHSSSQSSHATNLRSGLLALCLGCGLLSPAAFATNGYFAHGYSVSQKALGGAGTALANDALIAAINPAGLARLDDSLAVGFSLFSPIREFTASARGAEASNGIMAISPGTQRSHNEYFPLPAVAYKRSLGDWGSWGISLYGNGGMNTEYTDNSAVFAQGQVGVETECAGSLGGGRALSGEDPLGFCGNERQRTGVDMAILFLSPSLAVKLGENHALGIAPVFAMNRFAVQGLGAFAQFSNAPDKVSSNGHELTYGGGYRLGWLGRVLPGLRLGASYQSRIWMDEFRDYAGLFGEQGDFDIPESWNIGLALRLSPAHEFLLDYQQINYSDIRSVGNAFDPNAFVNNCAIPRLFGDTAESADCLGSATGPGFGWRDMSIYKLGYQYVQAHYKLRFGYSHTEQPIPSSEALFNVLAPGVIEQHFTAGASFRWSQRLWIDTALMYGAGATVRGKNPLSNTEANLLNLGGAGLGLDPLTAPAGQDTANAFGADPNDQDLTLKMDQFEVSIGISWSY